MSYAIYFFAMDAESVASQFRSARDELLQRVESHIREQNEADDERHYNEGQIRRTLAKAEAICERKLPEECAPEFFDALCWLAEVVGEKITIGSFLGFRHMQFLDEVGIWPWLLRSKPPFMVPVCKHAPPQVGFLSTDDIAKFALPAFAKLPAPRAHPTEVNYARQEFQEVVESLAEDKLDLLAVLM